MPYLPNTMRAHNRHLPQQVRFPHREDDSRWLPAPSINDADQRPRWRALGRIVRLASGVLRLGPVPRSAGASLATSTSDRSPDPYPRHD